MGAQIPNTSKQGDGAPIPTTCPGVLCCRTGIQETQTWSKTHGHSSGTAEQGGGHQAKKPRASSPCQGWPRTESRAAHPGCLSRNSCQSGTRERLVKGMERANPCQDSTCPAGSLFFQVPAPKPSGSQRLARATSQGVHHCPHGAREARPGPLHRDASQETYK